MDAQSAKLPRCNCRCRQSKHLSSSVPELVKDQSLTRAAPEDQAVDVSVQEVVDLVLNHGQEQEKAIDHAADFMSDSGSDSELESVPDSESILGVQGDTHQNIGGTDIPSTTINLPLALFPGNTSSIESTPRLPSGSQRFSTPGAYNSDGRLDRHCPDSHGLVDIHASTEPFQPRRYEPGANLSSSTPRGYSLAGIDLINMYKNAQITVVEDYDSDDEKVGDFSWKN